MTPPGFLLREKTGQTNTRCQASTHEFFQKSIPAILRPFHLPVPLGPYHRILQNMQDSLLNPTMLLANF